MNLATFLQACDKSTPMVIVNNNGVGGAAYLMQPGHELTAGDAEDMCCTSAYSVGNFEIRDGVLWVYANENPWCFGSYEEGEFYNEECQEYEVEYHGTVIVVEPSEDDAILMAKQMIADGEAESAYVNVVRATPIDQQ